MTQGDAGTVQEWVQRLGTPEGIANPHAIYAQIRKAAPLLKTPRAWLITKYRIAAALLKDFGRFGRGEAEKGFQKHLNLGDEPPYVLPMHFRDPPDHTRLRGLVSKAFTPRMVEQLRPYITEVTNQLIDEALKRGRLEFIEDFAYPLPLTIISRMLGLPDSDYARAREMSSLHSAALVTNDPEVIERSNTARRNMADHFRNLIAERRVHPKDDLMSSLLAVQQEDDEKLSEYEFIATLIGMTFAGHETTAGGLGSGLYLLLRHPSELERLRNNPEIMDTAIEEILRYEPPVGTAFRVAKTDVEVEGHTIRAGERIIALIAACNRDPEQFPEPDRFDLGRTPNKHLAWGGGIHFCLGAPLARVQIGIAFKTLFDRLPNLRLATKEIEWSRGAMRCPQKLMIEF